MNELETAVANALANSEDNKTINKAYLEFIKANFIVPIEKFPGGEEPEVLFYQEDDKVFLPVFSSMNYFDSWAEPIKDEIQLLKLSGVDLLKGIGKEVIVALNIGSAIYKEFNTSEIERMRSMVLKIM
ncbi:putative Fe-S center protein (plasmid) [Legionella adelaidensis]|uniref:Putative Fe-S center protein n=1 Tax=Legionella adelaidensis TaxID=45056 RepID=A0A0W0R5Z9_9GAMM|nr:SseB family protein [Legionella adelaidensis]KTC66453.1 putative Fe-S center protein [Legionella adelaidensis]VEH86259.1 putative Fe-S center protein [Legionella adelaidensis]